MDLSIYFATAILVGVMYNSLTFFRYLKYTPKQENDRGRKDWIAKVKIIKRGIKGIRHRVTSQYQEREKRSKFQLSVVCLTNRHLADFQI